MKNKVLRVKEAAELQNGITFPKGQEIEIVENVVYVNGYMFPPAMQGIVYGWITRNPTLFEDDTRDW